MMSRTNALRAIGLLLLSCLAPAPVWASDLAIRAKELHTVAGELILDGVVVIQAGKITAVGGPETPIPDGLRTIEAAVATPGLIDAHTVVPSRIITVLRSAWKSSECSPPSRPMPEAFTPPKGSVPQSARSAMQRAGEPAAGL